MALTYQDAGVDVALGDQASRILYEAAKQTWSNRQGRLGEVLVPFDDFSGLRAIDVSGLPAGTLMNIGFDGIGTKVEIAERMNAHRTLAHDLFAMVCDDAVIRGAEPVLLGSILDVNKLAGKDDSHIPQLQELAEGYVEAASLANVAVVNGELAEMGGRVGGFGEFCYNWGAAVVWFARKDRWITGHKVSPGDAIVGLQETGFRSNGISLVRRSFAQAHGEEWHNVEWEGKPLGTWALEPSKIYSKAVAEMTGGFADEPKAILHAAAHITGGGLPGKLSRALKPSGYGAVLDSLFAPSASMMYCQQCAQISDEEAYRTWHMGQGMVVITPEPESVIEVAASHGVPAQRIGTVQAEPVLQITSRGAEHSGAKLEFSLRETG